MIVSRTRGSTATKRPEKRQRAQLAQQRHLPGLRTVRADRPSTIEVTSDLSSHTGLGTPELEVIEAYLGAVLNELFGPTSPTG